MYYHYISGAVVYVRSVVRRPCAGACRDDLNCTETAQSDLPSVLHVRSIAAV